MHMTEIGIISVYMNLGNNIYAYVNINDNVYTYTMW